MVNEICLVSISLGRQPPNVGVGGEGLDRQAGKQCRQQQHVVEPKLTTTASVTGMLVSLAAVVAT